MTRLHINIFGLQGHIEVVRELLMGGANVNLKTMDNINAIYFATKTGQKDIVDLLIKNGASVNDQVSFIFC